MFYVYVATHITSRMGYSVCLLWRSTQYCSGYF